MKHRLLGRRRLVYAGSVVVFGLALVVAGVVASPLAPHQVTAQSVDSREALPTLGDANDPAHQSPAGEAPASEAATPLAPEQQRQLAEDVVAQDPQHRLLCEKPDGSVTVIVARRVDSSAKPAPPAAAGCKGGL
jgi:hypothetical protein